MIETLSLCWNVEFRAKNCKKLFLFISGRMRWKWKTLCTQTVIAVYVPSDIFLTIVKFVAQAEAEGSNQVSYE